MTHKNSECVKNHSVLIQKKNGIKFLVNKVKGYVSLEEVEYTLERKIRENPQAKGKTKRRLNTSFYKKR